MDSFCTRVAESAELFAFDEDVSAGHGVDDEGDDDAYPEVWIRTVSGG